MATVDAVVCLLADAGCQAEGLSHRRIGQQAGQIWPNQVGLQGHTGQRIQKAGRVTQGHKRPMSSSWAILEETFSTDRKAPINTGRWVMGIGSSWVSLARGCHAVQLLHHTAPRPVV